MRLVLSLSAPRLMFALAACAVICPTAIPTTTPVSRVAADPADAIAALRPEVRLRKLHLVRPDLIQYPLSYDVYC